ncbi:MAG: hypothetical protein KY456_09355 [Chloroflexi bacterium]|nr:hypothetical protein [Chloroflexota bacterium]
MQDTQFDGFAKALGAHELREVHAMDIDRFAGLTRTLAATGSRRRALAALAGGLFAALGGRRTGAANEPVRICHKTTSGTNSIVLIEVNDNAVPDHLAHGDFRYTDCCLDGDCDVGQACGTGSCQETCLGAEVACDPTKIQCCEGLVCCPGGFCGSSFDNCDGLD